LLKIIDCVDVNRLTDLAQSQLTQFYGREDFETLKNLLIRIPNAIPISDDAINNNEADDTKALQQQQQQPSSRRTLPSITEGTDDSETPSECISSVHRDCDGGYVNSAMLNNTRDNDLSVDDVNQRMAPNGDAVAGSLGLSFFVKAMLTNRAGTQSSHIAGEDGNNDQVPADGDVTGNTQNSSKSDDELVRRTTLQSFLEMVRSRPKDIIDRLNNDNSKTLDEVPAHIPVAN